MASLRCSYRCIACRQILLHAANGKQLRPLGEFEACQAAQLVNLLVEFARRPRSVECRRTPATTRRCHCSPPDPQDDLHGTPVKRRPKAQARATMESCSVGISENRFPAIYRAGRIGVLGRDSHVPWQTEEVLAFSHHTFEVCYSPFESDNEDPVPLEPAQEALQGRAVSRV